MKRIACVVVTMITIGLPRLAGAAGQIPDANAQRVLSAFVSYTDLRMASIAQCLRIVAATQEAQSGQWSEVMNVLSTYQQSDPGLAAWYALPDGVYYTAEKGLMDVTLRDRDYFPDLLAGRTVMGSLVVSKSTGKRSAVIAVPVMKNGEMVAAVGASLFLEDLSDQLVTSLSMPEHSSLFALAPNGLTALHTRQDRHFLDPRDLGSESLKTAAEQILATSEGAVTYEFEGELKHGVYRESNLTHWRFVIIGRGN